MLQQHIWHQTLAHMHILLCHACLVCDHRLCYVNVCARFTPSLTSCNASSVECCEHNCWAYVVWLCTAPNSLSNGQGRTPCASDSDEVEVRDVI